MLPACMQDCVMPSSCSLGGSACTDDVFFAHPTKVQQVHVFCTRPQNLSSFHLGDQLYSLWACD